MRDQSKQDRGCQVTRTERLVAIEILDRKDGYTPARLERKLRPVEPQLIRDAVASLERAGVVVVKRTRVHPTAALRRVDELELICI
jgi:hypothetical protein